MKKLIALLVLLLINVTAAHAQEPVPPKSGEFFQILTDCLALPRATVHECAIRYSEVTDPGSIQDFSLAPGMPTIHASIIKGKFNTCHMYPKDGDLPKGYSCFSNGTGQCVSGDCCTMFGGC